MIKCYGQDFRMQGDNNPHPGKPHTFKSVREACNSYAEFIADCDKWGYGVPGHYWLYKGTPDGDEEQCGYPDMPDYILSAGPRMGLKLERVPA